MFRRSIVLELLQLGSKPLKRLQIAPVVLPLNLVRIRAVVHEVTISDMKSWATSARQLINESTQHVAIKGLAEGGIRAERDRGHQVCLRYRRVGPTRRTSR